MTEIFPISWGARQRGTGQRWTWQRVLQYIFEMARKFINKQIDSIMRKVGDEFDYVITQFNELRRNTMIKENYLRKLAQIISFQEEIISELKLYTNRLITKYKIKKRNPKFENNSTIESEFKDNIDDQESDILKYILMVNLIFNLCWNCLY